MKIQNIGIMSPGDMGQAIAQQLKQKGFNVFTALDKRSARTRTLAQQVGLADVGSVAKLTEQCELILSVMNPGAALEFATEFAQALSVNRRKLLFADCNAIAPTSMQAINEKITAAGSRCVDGGIIGPPPRGTAKTRLYVSGTEARELEQLATAQIAVCVLSERIGDASAIKMCYAAMNKGTMAMVLELMIVARRFGVDAALEAQFNETHGPIYNKIMSGLPTMPPKAYRWVPEMLEIAQTFESAGLTRRMFEGAADLYEYIAATRIGKETPETRDKSRSGQEVVKLLADTPAVSGER